MVNPPGTDRPMTSPRTLTPQSHEAAADGAARIAPAQTNLALYRRLHDLGYAPADLLEIRRAYELATELFAGRFRACGRPFVTHLVGTASILAAIGMSRAVVAAGLLHAAYEQGDFGFTRWRHRRDRVRALVGAEVEDLVHGYDALEWNAETIARTSAALGSLDDKSRTIVLMRLANELDDHADFARELSGECEPQTEMDRENIVELATRLHQPELAAALRHAFNGAGDAAWLVPLRTNRKKSYQLAWRRGALILRILRQLPLSRYLPF